MITFAKVSWTRCSLKKSITPLLSRRNIIQFLSLLSCCRPKWSRERRFLSNGRWLLFSFEFQTCLFCDWKINQRKHVSCNFLPYCTTIHDDKLRYYEYVIPRYIIMDTSFESYRTWNNSRIWCGIHCRNGGSPRSSCPLPLCRLRRRDTGHFGITS